LKRSPLKRAIAEIPFSGVVYRRLKIAYLHLSFLREYHLFKRKSKSARFPIQWRDRHPCLYEKTSFTEYDRHYVYHTAWAARILAEIKPKEHVDISSYVYFATLISAFVPIRFYDIRPLRIELNGLVTGTADLLNLPFPDASIPSISCMHVVEHIGLGRYGEPIDPEGDLKAIEELKRVTAGGGNLLFVVPVGRPRIMFNAHRIYGYDQIRSYFSGFDLEEFALIPDSSDQGNLVRHATEQMSDAQEYACGCFWFRR